MSSFSPGPTVFMPGLVNYPGRLLTSVTRHIGCHQYCCTADGVLTVCHSHDGVGDRLIRGSWILDVLTASKSGRYADMQIATVVVLCCCNGIIAVLQPLHGVQVWMLKMSFVHCRIISSQDFCVRQAVYPDEKDIEWLAAVTLDHT